MKTAGAAMLALLFLIVMATAYAASPSLIQQFRTLSPSVGALYVQTFEGDLKFNCTVTATGLQDARIVVTTAYHCVQKGRSYTVSFDGKQFHGAEVWKLPRWVVDEQNQKKKWGEPDVDMAQFLVNDAQVPVVPFGDDRTIEPGARIVSVGFPLGITKTSYEGIVAGRLDKPGDDWHGYLTLQIFGAPGSSGTSIVSADSGQVIGILVAAAQSMIGLPVILATPVSYQIYLMEVPR